MHIIARSDPCRDHNLCSVSDLPPKAAGEWQDYLPPNQFPKLGLSNDNKMLFSLIARSETDSHKSFLNVFIL